MPLWTHTQEIADLRNTVNKLSRSQSINSLNTNREAFIGGFSYLKKEALKDRVATVIGHPKGFLSIEVPGNISSFAFIRFDTPDSMQACVEDLTRKGLPGDLRIKPNRPKTEESKARSNAFWTAKQLLIRKGWNETNLSVSRGRIWELDATGGATCLGSLHNGTVEWEPEVFQRLQHS